MRIGIDARFYGPRVGGGGLGRYVAELVTHLQQIDHTNEYVIFLRKENFHECVIHGGNFVKRMVDVPWYTLAEQTVMPREVAVSRVNIMHYPHWNVPVLTRVPFVVTIHDLILLEDPSSARATTRNALVHGIKYMGFRLALENAVHRSKSIISVSEYTRQSLLKHFRVSPHKVRTIYNGVSAPGNGEGVDLRALGVTSPYILHVGNAYPHKNLEALLEAFQLVAAERPDVSLVFAGRRDMYVERLEELATKLGLTSANVKFLNLPTDDEVAALYQHAALFIFPSRLEGFGIPPLEAMHYGTRVAASNAASMPEILGKAARYFAPEDQTAMTRLMLDAVERPHSYADVQRNAAEQIRRYSWKKMAEQTLDVYLKSAIRRV
jgi:glycosyltransferase involved in cell wall biosynthesis